MSGCADPRALIRLVDDDADFLEGLSFMLEAKGWRTASYLRSFDFLTGDSPSVPGCLILDIRMPEMSGIELQREMKTRGIDLPIIVLTGHADVDSAVKTLKMGAVDFLQKPADSEELFDSVENAVRLSFAKCLGGLAPDRVEATLAGFSAREKAVTRFLKMGLANAEVAERLGLTAKTIRNYRNTVYGKLRVHNAGELFAVLDQVPNERLNVLLSGGEP